MPVRAARRSSTSAGPRSAVDSADMRETVRVDTTSETESHAGTAAASVVPAQVFHYSEDGTHTRFVPHVPQTNPSHPPAVWALDADHAPLYWFPRNCPRISVWATSPDQQEVLTATFETDASRICAAESHWLDGVRTARVYRYTFDGAQFAPWAAAAGQYISGEVVVPQAIDALDDLLMLHAQAEVELRFTPKLGTLMDKMLASGLPFSFVRIRDARR
jgi:Family of unknown function (DUF6886)